MTERLRKILRGGKLTPMTADEAAVKIAVDNAGGGDAGLPAVTTDDNGKVLGVVNGAWDKTEPPAGAMVIVGNVVSGIPGNITITDELSDILAAHQAGTPVYLSVSGTNAHLPLVAAYADGVDVFLDFIAPFYGEADTDYLVLGVKFMGSKTGTAAFLTQSGGNDYKITLTATVDEQTQQAVITADKTVADINAAAVAGKHCFAVKELAPGTYQRYELYHYSASQVTFYGVEMDEEGGASIAKPVVIEGAATGIDHDQWTVID